MIVAGILIGIAHINMNIKFSYILENVGFGLFGSVVVALLIDIANTHQQNIDDVKKADELVDLYRRAFLHMRDSVLEIAEYAGCLSNKKRTFNEWLTVLYKEIKENVDENEYYELYFPLAFSVEEISLKAEKLVYILQFHMDNTKIDFNYRKNVKHIQSVSSCIYRDLDEREYKKAINTIIYRLVPDFLKYNKYDEYFLEPYCVDHWEYDVDDE